DPRHRGRTGAAARGVSSSQRRNVGPDRLASATRRPTGGIRHRAAPVAVSLAHVRGGAAMSALHAAIGILVGGVLLLLGGAARRRVFAQDRSLAALLDLPGEAVVDPRSISTSRLDRIIELFFATPAGANKGS